MACTGFTKKNLQKTHFIFGNDFPEKKSSYFRDYGPETKIFDAIQSTTYRPQSPAEVIPGREGGFKRNFLTSHKQDFGHYSKEINFKLYSRCLKEYDETKQFHRGAKVVNFEEKLPPLARFALDYRAHKIAAPCNTPVLLKNIRAKNNCLFEPKTLWTEAKYAFRWPKQVQLPPTLTGQYHG